MKEWLTLPPWRRTRRQVLSLLLLLLLFSGVVYGLADAVRGIEPGFLWPLVWCGFLLGWLLAHVPWPGWLRTALGLLTGAGLVFFQVGELGRHLADLFTGLALAPWRWLRGQEPAEWAAVQTAWGGLAHDSAVLVARFWTWLQGLFGDQAVVDPVPVVLLWGVAMWASAVWAGWIFGQRSRALWLVAPAAGLLAMVLAYVDGQPLYLLPVLGSTLVLQAWLEYERNRRAWQREGIPHPARAWSDTIWLAIGLSLGLMVAATIVPSISVYRLAELVASLGEDSTVDQELARSLGLDPQAGGGRATLTLLDARRSAGLPTRHLIGSGPELSEQVVMHVSLESAPDAVRESAPNYYWRSLTYDRYTERGWSAEYAGRVRYAAGEGPGPASAPHGQRLRQRVRRVGDESGLLYVAGTLVTADHAFRIAWRSLPGEEGPGDVYGALVDANVYRADSLLPVVGQADLRAADQDYPGWVVDRYLTLPDSVPDRVWTLARELTAAEATAYDRALALEGHLRQFPYRLDLPPPPTDRDVVDYFLFDLQMGYCDYYASAMVVLARAAGLPARLVTGYATGTYDEAAEHYVVSEAEAHAWPEIYFPEYGWIGFEPTAGRPAVERPAGTVAEPPVGSKVSQEPITNHRLRVRWAWWLGGIGGLLLLAVAGFVVWFLADGWRLRRVPPGVAVTRVFRRLYHYGAPLGVPFRDGDTPQEFAAALQVRVKALAAGRRWGWLLVSGAAEIDWLAALCGRSLYSPHPTQPADRARAIRIWQRLWPRLWLARLLT